MRQRNCLPDLGSDPGYRKTQMLAVSGIKLSKTNAAGHKKTGEARLRDLPAANSKKLTILSGAKTARK